MGISRRVEFLILIFLVFVFFLVLVHRAVFLRTNGEMVYSYDDAYIHMALSKNLAKHGVFGITPRKYTPAASSILWDLLLSFSFLIFGVNTWIPLIFNIVLSIILIYLLWKITFRYNLYISFFIITVFLAVLPIYHLIYSGMEHILHIIVVLLLSLEILSYLKTSVLKPSIYWISLIAVGVRYETYFILLPFLFVLFLERKFKETLILLGTSSAVPAVFAVVNIAHGWGPFPSSISIKGNSLFLSYLFRGKIYQAFVQFLKETQDRFSIYFSHSQYQILPFVLIFFALLLLAAFSRRRKSLFYLPAVVLLIHATFSYFTNPPRYQSYLFAIILVFLLEIFSEEKFQKTGFAVFLGFLLFSFGEIFLANFMVPIACSNIYSQHIQMARFIGMFYPEGKVVINDIGAVSFYNDHIKIVDFGGLADGEVYRIRKAPIPPKKKVALLKNYLANSHADLAIVYKKSIGKALPKQWEEIGEWTISQSAVVPFLKYTFYKISDPLLEEKLRIYSTFLPDVYEEGKYKEEGKNFLNLGNFYLYDFKETQAFPPRSSRSFSFTLPPGNYRFFLKVRGKGTAVLLVLGGKVYRFYPYKVTWYPCLGKFQWEGGKVSGKIINLSDSLFLLAQKVLFVKTP